MFNAISSLPSLAMFGLSAQELFIILAIVLIVFGASKLPQLGEGLGKSIKNFKKAMKDEGGGAAAADKSEEPPRTVVQVEVQRPEALEAPAETPAGAKAEAADKVGSSSST